MVLEAEVFKIKVAAIACCLDKAWSLLPRLPLLEKRKAVSAHGRWDGTVKGVAYFPPILL